MFFGDCEKSTQQQLADNIAKFYNCTVYTIQPKALPNTAYYQPRNRYRADKLLTYLTSLKTPNSNLLAFTNKDISVTKGNIYDYGVMGLGSPSTGVSVMSTYRLNGKARANKILNTALHEIGHTYKLPHCPNRKCLMRDAEGKLWPEDSLTPYMCENCKKKLKH